MVNLNGTAGSFRVSLVLAVTGCDGVKLVRVVRAEEAKEL